MVEQLVNRGDRGTYSGNRRSYILQLQGYAVAGLRADHRPSIYRVENWEGGRGSISAIARNCCK